MIDENEDPETAYRRGYQQGAFAAMEAAERCQNTPTGWNKIRNWVNIEIANWRYGKERLDRNRRPPAIKI